MPSEYKSYDVTLVSPDCRIREFPVRMPDTETSYPDYFVLLNHFGGYSDQLSGDYPKSKFVFKTTFWRLN
jgi:hypothetical protein